MEDGPGDTESDPDAQLATCRALNAQLRELTAALCGALSLAEVADEVSSHSRAALGSHFAGVAVVDHQAGTLRYLSMAPLPPSVVREWSEFPLSERVPASEAVRTGRASRYRSRADIVADYPDIADDLAQAGTEAMVTVPLVARGRTIGSLMLTWTNPHELDEDERSFLDTLAGQCALAIVGPWGPDGGR